MIAGCDGFHGVCRAAIPAGALRDVRARVPVRLARHPRRGRAVERRARLRPPRARLRAAHRCARRRSAALYLQCRPDEDIAEWPDDRIWEELQRRTGSTAGRCNEGPILEKGVTGHAQLRREPMRHGRLFLAGDAAHIVPPTGAKGLNLAIADVRILAEALDRTGTPGGDERCSTRYSDDVPAPRLARRALLVVDDVDAAPRRPATTLRPAAPALAAPLRRRPRAPRRRRSPRTTSAWRGSDGVVFDALFVPDRVLAELSDRAWLQAMLDSEAALAVAEAAVGTDPVRRRPRRSRRAAAPSSTTPRAIAPRRRRVGQPGDPLVRALRERVGGEPAALRASGGDEPGRRRHGRDAGRPARARARARGPRRGRGGAARPGPRAPGHADGRPHAAAAGAADDLRAQGRGLARRGRRGAAAGSPRPRLPRRAARRGRRHAGVAGRATARRCVAALARELGLAEPALPWHTARDARRASWRAALGAAAARWARSRSTSSLLAQTEVGEVASRRARAGAAPRRMPHKRNPVAVARRWPRAPGARRCAPRCSRRMAQEHERAAGAWHAEWEALPVRC